MRDYWVSGWCGFTQFARHKPDERLKDRQRFIRKWCKPQFTEVWPFVHSVSPVPDLKWDGFVQRLDHLVIPLVKAMNKLPGIKTVTSCQGHAYAAPYVFFQANDKAVATLAKFMKQWDAWHYWNEWFINWACDWSSEPGGGYMWELQFYDTIALMKFTKEVLHVPVAKQIAVPRSIAAYARKNGYKVPTGPSVAEYERLLKDDK